jgi:hypothetical protein
VPKPPIDRELVKNLQALCDQAKQLRDSADKLCAELTARLEASRARLATTKKPFVERRKKPRAR